jgi:hypothetical protein
MAMNVGLGESRDIVNTVSDHRDNRPLALQPCDDPDLLLGQTLCAVVDAELGGHRPRHALYSASHEEKPPNAKGSEAAERFGDFGTERVSHRDKAHKARTFRDVDYGAPLRL